jgi:hypothetical protein
MFEAGGMLVWKDAERSSQSRECLGAQITAVVALLYDVVPRRRCVQWKWICCVGSMQRMLRNADGFPPHSTGEVCLKAWIPRESHV